jgi:MFS family permease
MLGISWHVMAMFGPSFVTGRLIMRFGADRIVAAGLVLLFACAGAAISGFALWNFWMALILLGLGWNFGFIGATTMVAESYRPSEKTKAQGFNDFVLFTSVAVASLLSGAVYNAWGWAALNWIIVPVAGTCLLLLVALNTVGRRKAPV